MPDISMCLGGKCKLKENCYRFKAKPSEYRQSYLAKPPFKDDRCDYYYPIKEKDD